MARKLFRRKVGGTALGNTFRSLTNKLSGGLLGNGLLLKTAQTVEPEPITQTIAKVSNDVNTVVQSNINQPTNQKTMKEKIIAFVTANKTAVMIGAAVTAVVVFLFIRSRKTGTKTRR